MCRWHWRLRAAKRNSTVTAAGFPCLNLCSRSCCLGILAARMQFAEAGTELNVALCKRWAPSSEVCMRSLVFFWLAACWRSWRPDVGGMPGYTPQRQSNEAENKHRKPMRKFSVRPTDKASKNKKIRSARSRNRNHGRLEEKGGKAGQPVPYCSPWLLVLVASNQPSLTSAKRRATR